MNGRMERVIVLLRTRRSLCSLDDLYGRSLANGRNDIGVLRRRGWEIEATLSVHEEGRGAHSHYRLISEPPPDQVRLIA